MKNITNKQFVQGIGNDISETVEFNLGHNAKLLMGDYNSIADNVIISVPENMTLEIGDCNRIGNNTKLLVDEIDMKIGDWNVIHNDMLILGGAGLTIGHNCWFGQNTILDGSGVLAIGSGVRVGMYSQIWTHVASGELIEGCTLYGKKSTVIEDNVWLVGSCFVGSGITLGRNSVCLAGSNLTKSTDAFGVYAGMPAKKKERLNFWKTPTVSEKYLLLKEWLGEEKFLQDNDVLFKEIDIKGQKFIKLTRDDDVVIYGDEPELYFEVHYSLFCIRKKTYNKKKTALERFLYRYLYGNKARFLPILIKT